MKLQQVAQALGAELRGDGARDVTGVAGIEHAGPSEITFVSNPKYAPLAKTTQAAAILVTPDFPDIATPTLRTANPYLSFAHAIDLFFKAPQYPPGIHPTAQISPTARIGADAHIGAYAVVMDGVTIGARARLLPHVVIYPCVEIGDDFFAHAHAVVREGCRIGHRVILQNSAIIGSDGFGFAKDGNGRWNKITQSGPVILEDDVEVQALAAIDRASVGETRIGRGSKVDNLVQVGHGSTVGEDSLLCAQVGLAGSTEIGNHVVLAGQVGVAGHLKIGDNAVATAKSGIHGDVAPGQIVSGYPAVDNKQWLRASVTFSRLPELVRRLGRIKSDATEEKPSP
jgi:UDP-3-O-[3-hydroxymyristoyl] glucosamine N-acyltransferase